MWTSHLSTKKTEAMELLSCLCHGGHDKALGSAAPWCLQRIAFSRQRIAHHHMSLLDYSLKAKLSLKLTQSHIPKSVCTFTCNQENCLLQARHIFNSSWTTKEGRCILFDSLVHVFQLFLLPPRSIIRCLSCRGWISPSMKDIGHKKL